GAPMIETRRNELLATLFIGMAWQSRFCSAFGLSTCPHAAASMQACFAVVVASSFGSWVLITSCGRFLSRWPCFRGFVPQSASVYFLGVACSRSGATIQFAAAAAIVIACMVIVCFHEKNITIGYFRAYTPP